MHVEYRKIFYTIQKSTCTFLIITWHALNHSEITDASTHIERSLFFDSISFAWTIPVSGLPYIRYTVSGHFLLIFQYFIIYVDSVHYLRRIRKTNCIEQFFPSASHISLLFFGVPLLGRCNSLATLSRYTNFTSALSQNAGE